jgi:hypothetical protein
MATQSQKNSETLIRLESRIETIENNHLQHIQTSMEKMEVQIQNIWKVILGLSAMFIFVFADSVKSLIDLVTIL